ncbi:hypothetical protein PR202_gb03584 [Eleusine coracana subsp. coracana]|uniref:Protein kinase domain-containing protein n=1 Tax=Eleusine coracana subsp. coracana TaxID=191504 RepID=A0AAV5E267_ELECO|nr:hypothetical protein PR202_gb03584 [Eleusine coracana subsp. coracana]
MDRRRRPLDNDITLFLGNKKTMAAASVLCCLVLVFFSASVAAQMPGFVSIDCGGSGNYTDELGLVWTGDAGWFPFGATANISVPSEEKRTQYSTVRYFPSLSPASSLSSSSSKHCYTLGVRTRTRYLVRASFLYGNFDRSNVFPEFDLYLGASRWSTIVIYDEATVVTREAVVLASSPTLSVCLSNATTGQPFISTLELRQLNGSLYYTDYESNAFLGLSARINFGAPNTDAVRYPDDPYDRIWESDMVRRANYLVDVSPGTLNVSTDKPVFVSSNERPPQKVMQTAVVGSLGELTYRLDLNGFPGNGWAFSYFAEIQEFVVPETRKFKLYIPGLPDVSKPTVDIAENAPGKYRLYEPGFFNISLPFVLSFAFRKTNDSSKGPILNAFEIYKYIHIDLGSPDDDVTKILSAQKLHNSNRQSCEITTETAHPFKLSDLEVATNNFANRIGSGGFGIVYYGKLDDGKEIAVKVPTNDSYQGKKQFTNEVSLLSRIHHRNLVSFLGYCHQDGRNILVYEFMHNGTLKEHLHGRDKHISWIKRLEIAEDAAKGIEYLHTGCTPSIIHRDIKTSNILLDKQMRAKVSDFGLSKFVAEDSHASTNVRGTLGYLDPQYYISQQLTEKSDIYSFGIILLELISGRPPISTITFGEHFRNIGPWAKFYYESGDIEAIIDPSMGGEYQDVQSIWKIAEAAVRCIDIEPRKRPCMPEVVKEIQEAMALERTATSDVRGGCPFSPAAASVRSAGTMRSHDMVMDNLLLMDEDSSSFSGSVSKLKYPELR